MKFSIGKLYRTRPILSLLFVFVVIPLCYLFYQANLYVQSSLTNNDGATIKTGVQSEVSITRDEHGIPKIKADSDYDAFFAVGFMHAQDRLWQLELQRRMAQGRLSEVFGKGASQFDIYIRTLRIYNNAIESLPAISTDAQLSLQAYADGINAWVAQADKLPLEFSLMNIEPAPWQTVDSLAWMKMFALSMSGNFQEDLNRLTLSHSLGHQKVATLYGQPDGEEITTLPVSDTETLEALVKLTRLTEEVQAQWNIGGHHIGSNAWVVAAKHSQNGHAILANDPHLNMELPSMWYILDVQGEHFHSTGMSIVGSPLVMLGRNEHIAWGATNMLADTMDLYFEQINPQNVNQYKRGEEWKDFNVRTEYINVKADFPSFLREPLEPLKVEIRETDHGPVISDLVSELKQPVSLRWVGGESQDTSYEAFYKLTYASNWNEFESALALHRTPAMNLFYIDQQDNIGYLGTGDVPIRGQGLGNTPVPAWDESFAWSGFIPKAMMPRSFNPEQGFLLSANNRVSTSQYPYYISDDWAEPERAERINQLLTGVIERGQKLTMEDHKTFQMDMIDLQAKKMLPSLMQFTPDGKKQESAFTYLNEWDGSTAPDQIAPTIFFSWMRHLRNQLFADDMSGHWGNPGLTNRFNKIVKKSSLQRIERALNDSTFDWCDKQSTPEFEQCEQIMTGALKAALVDLDKEFGEDMAEWQWGKAHKIAFEHRPFTHIKGLDLLFDREYPRGGSPDSINVSSFSYSHEDNYVQAVGPGFRHIITFSDQQPTQMLMNSTGQSGNVVSQHYDDMAEPFIAGQYLAIGQQPKVSEFRLVPQTTLRANL